MIYRMGAALLSLAGLFISAYLYLYKIGEIGTLACGTGGCETVQLSPWSRFPGRRGRAHRPRGLCRCSCVLSLASLQPALAPARWPVSSLAALSGSASLFTLYLTYLELFVIHAICRWCVASAFIIVAILVLVAARSAPAAPGARH